MDDPTRWCENDTDNGTRLLGAPGPKRGPHFFCGAEFFPAVRCWNCHHVFLLLPDLNLNRNTSKLALFHVELIKRG